MTGSDIENIFSSKNNTSNYFSECEKKLRDNKNIKSYWDTSDSNPEILENRKQMDEVKNRVSHSSEILDFFQKNYFSDDKKWKIFLDKFEFRPKDKYFFSKKDPKKIKELLLEFYKTHPFLTPFVGEKYGTVTVLDKKIKVLYVLESHYLPTFSKVYEGYDNDDNKQEWLWKHWYASDWAKQIPLYREDLEYMWTENVIKYNMLNNGHFINMFKRMLLPLYDTIKNDDNINIQANPAKGIERINNDDIKTIIEGIAFMNYYLRPAEATGSHINPEQIDNLFSFFNLLLVWESLGEPCVIICSSRAANAFESYAKYLLKEEISLSLNDKFVRCNHPSSLSWFKEIKEDNTNVWFNSNVEKRTSYEIQKEFYMSCPDFQINKNQ